MPKISALIITLNEAENIGSVIENLSFTDEILVIDSFSSDETVSIAKSYSNVKVFQNTFEDFTKQRNFALSKANYEWILFLDADERVTEPLQDEIMSTIKQENTADAYFFYRKFMFKNEPLHFSGWQTDKNIRLFKKSKARYTEERLVHEVLEVDGKISLLKNKLIHYSYDSYESYKKKMLSYARLKAKELHNKGIKPNAFHYIIKPVYKFIHGFIIRLGFLDGKKGLIICYLNALSVYKRYPYVKEISE
jgi:glycosyltransferase involved in cell wall biosynthesis